MCPSYAKEVLSQQHIRMLTHPPESRAFHQNKARKTLERDNVVSLLSDNKNRSIQGTRKDGLGIQTRSLGILGAELLAAAAFARSAPGPSQPRSSQRDIAAAFLGFCSALVFSVMFTTRVSNHLPAVSGATAPLSVP